MTAHEQLQPNTAELAAKMIDGMGFEPIAAAGLAEVVRLSLEEGRAAGKDECADHIATLTARVSELERERHAFRQAIDERLAGYEEKAARDDLTAFGRHAQSIVKSIKAYLDRAALPPIPGEASR